MDLLNPLATPKELLGSQFLQNQSLCIKILQKKLSPQNAPHGAFLFKIQIYFGDNKEPIAIQNKYRYGLLRMRKIVKLSMRV